MNLDHVQFSIAEAAGSSGVMYAQPPPAGYGISTSAIVSLCKIFTSGDHIVKSPRYNKQRLFLFNGCFEFE